MKAGIQAIFAALFVAGAPFLFAFGLEGVAIMLGIPAYRAPRLSVMQQDLAAVAALIVGALLAASFWGSDPQWRKTFGWLTGAGLLGVVVLFVVVY